MMHYQQQILMTMAIMLLLWGHVGSLQSDLSTFTMPLNVVIWTVGIYKKDIDLEPLLAEVLPRYSPPLHHDVRAHDIQLRMSYAHKEAPKSFVDKYKAYILKQDKDSDNYHTVIINEFASFLEKEMQQTGFQTSFPIADTFTLPLLMVNLPELPPHMFIAHSPAVDEYVTDKCSLSVIASVAFIDFSARSCDLHAAITHNAKHVRWSSPDPMHPYPFTFHTPDPNKVIYTPPKEAFNAHLSARMVGVVTSAVQSFGVGSLKWRPAHSTEKIYCPIVVLKSGAIAEEGRERRIHPNLPVIKKWLSSLLLPWQELVIVSSDHFVDEHPMLSVAVASAHMTYAALVDAGGGSQLGGGAQQQQHVERIPYIDSAVLLRELTSVGDSLCNMLLKQTGHGELVHNLILTEMLNNQSTLVASYGSKPVRKQAEVAALEKSLKTAVVVPIFVLSDLHIHHEREQSANDNAAEKKLLEKKSGKKHQLSKGNVEEEDRLLPVQPLLNKDSPVAIATDSRSAVVVHSSSGMVATFSPYTHVWRNRVDLTDVDSLIAEGLTRALTGLNAPYAQLQEAKDTLDLTWTHGAHPFYPFGYLPPEAKPDTHHGVLAAASRRTILASRCHRLMQRALQVVQRTSALQQEIDQVLVYLQNLKASNDKQTAAAIVESIHTHLGPGESVLDVDRFLAPMMSSRLTDVQGKQTSLIEQMEALRKSLEQGETSLKPIETAFHTLDYSMEVMEAYIEQSETEIHAQMKNCHLAFDTAISSPYLSQLKPGSSSSKPGKTRQQRPSQANSPSQKNTPTSATTSAGGQPSVSSTGYSTKYDKSKIVGTKKPSSSGRQGASSYVLAIMGVVFLAMMIFGIWKVSTYTLERAKKMK